MMRTINVPIRDVMQGDVIDANGVMHRVFTNVNHPAGRMLLGGHQDNTYIIRSYNHQAAAFETVEVKRK